MEIRLEVENPHRSPLRRNLNADRSLKLDESVFRVHRELMRLSPVLERLLQRESRTMLNLDHLKSDQKHFTAVGLNMAVDWMYGTPIEFSTNHLTDALAASFVLEMYDMVCAIEEAVLNVQCYPEAMVILLYHIDNFTPETKQQLLMAAAAQIDEISLLEPFVGLSPSIFKRVMKIAVLNVEELENKFEVIRAIIIWAAENHHRDLTMSLLQPISMAKLTNADAHALHRMAMEAGLETMAAAIFSRYHGMTPTPEVRQLFRENAEPQTNFVDEQNAVRETVPNLERRLTAGKNISTADEDMDTAQITEPEEGVEWKATPHEREAFERMAASFDRVHFGSVPLNCDTTDVHVEIHYAGRREAAKDNAVKLFFDFEIDQPCVSI
ncbi:hypothetical protein Q1695_007818 [Nippostrongylus brasiliensis]|nr:hypothetical protein Q1695_007818 [Nippostrongylus brasiliensis]